MANFKLLFLLLNLGGIISFMLIISNVFTMPFYLTDIVTLFILSWFLITLNIISLLYYVMIKFLSQYMPLKTYYEAIIHLIGSGSIIWSFPIYVSCLSAKENINFLKLLVIPSLILLFVYIIISLDFFLFKKGKIKSLSFLLMTACGVYSILLWVRPFFEIYYLLSGKKL